MARVEIACTLTADAAVDRTGEWADVIGHAQERTSTESGARLRFARDPALAGRLAELAAREADCCAFFTFGIEVTHHAVWLEVSAPPDGLPVLEALFVNT